MRILGTVLVLVMIALIFFEAGCGTTPSNSCCPILPSGQFVQSAGTTVSPTGGGQSFTTTFSGNVTPNNTIVMVFWWMHDLHVTTGISGVSDSEGNLYQLALDSTGVVNSSTAADILYYIAPNVKGGTSAAVTITTNVAAFSTQISMVVLEYSGVAAVDATNTGSILSGSTESTGTSTIHAAPEIILGSMLITETTTKGSGAGFNSRFQSDFFVMEDKSATATGDYDAEFSLPPPYPEFEIAIPSMVTLRFAVADAH